MANMIFGQKRRIFLKILLFVIFLATPIIGLAQNIYYVDSTIGSDSYSCEEAQNPATPKRTVNGVMSCNPGPGDIVKFRGTFTQGIYPTRSGEVLYAFQPIQRVSGSTVTFSNSISGLNPATDYVTIYNSRKGNSGAFAVVDFSGNSVTVDTSFLPLGRFVRETASDPGDLHGAILRPVHFTAWNKNNPPVWDGSGQTFHSLNKTVIMVSYLKTITDVPYWKAFEIDGSNNGNCDYHIFDHLEVTKGEGAIGIEFHEFHSNYNIIQYGNFHHTGYPGEGPDEIIYYGNAFHPERHHDYVQIMYNIVGPHRSGNELFADGIEIKPSAHYATVWGNEVVGINCGGSDDSPITTDGTATVIGNNYVHDINPTDLKGCGISIKDTDPSEPTHGANGAIIINNIIANVKRVGMWILDVSNVKVSNNIIYNIFPEPDGSDLNYSMGILIRNYQGPAENIEIKNNIVQKVPYGIGISHNNRSYPITVSNDYNIVYDASLESFHGISQNTNDMIVDPMFVNAVNSNFHLQSISPAIDNGTALSDVAIDFDSISRPQYAGYDIGAYEYHGTNPPFSVSASANPASGPAPLTVNFSGSASGGSPPYSYEWTFGDGDSSTAQNPSHTYSTIDTYTATLTVTDSESNTTSKSITIYVFDSQNLPSVVASANPTSGQVPLTVSFSGSATGGTPPYSYSWVFGDGGSSTAQNPSHTYSSNGTYTATLTVTDSMYASASASVSIIVSTVPVFSLALDAETGAPASGQGGTTDPSPGTHTFTLGSNVSIQAISNTDYRFSNWEGDVAPTNIFNPTIELIMNNNKSISATFCTKCADVNGDLEITPSDAQSAFDIFLERKTNPTWCELENADVNGSGTNLIPEVTPADAQLIFSLYLQKGIDTGDCSGASRAASIATQNMTFKDVSLTIDDIVVSSSQDILIPVIVESPSEITAFGFDLEFPSDVLAFIGLERTELTENYVQLDANVIPYHELNRGWADTRPEETPDSKFKPTIISKTITPQSISDPDIDTTHHKTLRVGGYKTDTAQNPSFGVLVTLVFRVTGRAENSISLSITTTYDDIKNATIRSGMINRQNNSLIIEDKRPHRNIKKLS